MSVMACQSCGDLYDSDDAGAYDETTDKSVCDDCADKWYCQGCEQFKIDDPGLRDEPDGYCQSCNDPLGAERDEYFDLEIRRRKDG